MPLHLSGAPANLPSIFRKCEDSGAPVRQTGITQLGGHGIYLSPGRMQISHGENARDTANVLSRYGEAIAIRHCAFGEGNAYLNEVAEHASVRVHMQSGRVLSVRGGWGRHVQADRQRRERPRRRGGRRVRSGIPPVFNTTVWKS